MKQLITIIFIILSINSFSQTIFCPPDTLYYACSFDDISLHSKFPYSETSKIITLVQLQDEGGNASSECGIKKISYSDAEQNTIYQILILKRTYVLKDSCNKVAQCSQFIYINDKEPPSILKFPKDFAIEGCSTDELETYSALPFSEITSEINLVDTSLIGISVADNCGIKKISYLDVINGTCPIFIERNFFVNDIWDNVATFIQHIFIDDTTAPLIACPPNVDYEACTLDDIESLTSLPFSTVTSTITLAQFTAAGGTAGDNWAIKEINYVDSQSGTCPIEITRTFTVIDSCDNTNTCDQVFQIDDTTPPTISCPTGQTYEACTVDDIESLTTLPFTTTQTTITLAQLTATGGTAYDNCAIMEINYLDQQFSKCPITIIRTFTVIDSCYNTSTCDQTITIDDNTPLVFSCPTDTTIEECLTQQEIDDSYIKWLANADVSLSGGCNATISNNAPTSAPDYCGGSVTVTWTITDDCVNDITCTATFTVSNTVPPTITCSPDIQFNDIEDFYFKSDSLMQEIDIYVDCNYDYYLVIHYPSLDSLIDTIEVFYTITDECGNSDVCLVNFVKSNNLPTTIIPTNIDIKLTCNIYPNPNKGIFILNIIGTKNKFVLVDIFGSAGKHIYCKELLMETNSLDYKINLSGQAKGVYYIKISDGVNVATKSIVIH